MRPGADSTPGGHVHPGGTQVRHRLGDVLGPQAARQTIRRWWSATPSASRQSKTWPDPGLSPSTRQEVGAELLEAPDGALAGLERLDHRGHPCPHPLRLLGRLVPVQLGRAQPGDAHRLHDALGRLVAEDAHRQHVLGEPLGDVARQVHRDLPRRGREHEPHRRQLRG